MAFSAGVFANNGTSPIDPVVKKQIEKLHLVSSKAENPQCTVTCSISFPNDQGGFTTIGTSAGNWFTSCDKAAAKCLDKLKDAIN